VAVRDCRSTALVALGAAVKPGIFAVSSTETSLSGSKCGMARSSCGASADHRPAAWLWSRLLRHSLTIRLAFAGRYQTAQRQHIATSLSTASMTLIRRSSDKGAIPIDHFALVDTAQRFGDNSPGTQTSPGAHRIQLAYKTYKPIAIAAASTRPLVRRVEHGADDIRWFIVTMCSNFPQIWKRAN
jgi:hypothetical protein